MNATYLHTIELTIWVNEIISKNTTFCAKYN
ncbi:hypothetical protein Enr17x_33950 [Gimesia fumaroli]|uniref:Uncharacterized protein n=1 Tax=Gimesia fumaroli TaxID=2527976 RepID=A0A518IE24_9PLAN|nr:hypothetical protein Enr17x_33950 [Gimesia fumaroli]